MFTDRELKDEEDEESIGGGAAAVYGFGGSSKGSSTDGESSVEDDGGSIEGGEGEGKGEVTTQSNVSQGIDPTAAFQAVAQAMQYRQQPEVRQEQQPEVTQEQLDAALKVYRVNPASFQKVFDADVPLEERVAALQEMLDGTATHAAAVAGYTTQFAAQQLRDEMSPALQSNMQQVNQAFSNDVVRVFPGLSGREQLLNSVIDQMHEEGWRASGPDPRQHKNEAMLEVAKRATIYGRMVDPNFDVRFDNNQEIKKQVEQKQVLKPAQLASGGQSGGGGQSQTQAGEQKPLWQQALG